ncbi:Arf GTPase-activating protein [Entamoeba marina]
MENEALQKSFFDKEMLEVENQKCFDCGKQNPTWCSLNNAIYLCMECAGKHRGYGVHISFVRSINLDSFKPNQLVMMKLGGNKRAKEYFDEHPLDPPTHCVKLDCESADAYRRLLKRKTCEETGDEYIEPPPWRPTRRMKSDVNQPVVGGGQRIVPINRQKKTCCGCECCVLL